MRILILNCGSSSVKFQLIQLPAAGAPAPLRLADIPAAVLAGQVDGVGPGARLAWRTDAGKPMAAAVAAPDHAAAVGLVLQTVAGAGHPVDAVGHRIVHGGARFVLPTRVDDVVLAALDKVGELAPLHNGPGLLGVRAAMAALGAAVPMVAVFDTAFHAAMPDRAAAYALPADWVARFGIRRYGFHGISYASLVEQVAGMTGGSPDGVSMAALHLGSGCSIAAIREGRSIDTSMGFTPLEGLVMGTRSGDADPALVAYLAEHAELSASEVVLALNRRAGLLGLSGTSADMRALLAAEATDPRARLAIEVFCYRARKSLAAHIAALGGAPVVAFTGAMGANAPSVRARVLQDMGWCGLELDPDRNAGAVGAASRISPDGAAVEVYAIPPAEERYIARATYQLLTGDAE